DQAAGGGRSVEKQDATGVGAGVFPGVRDIARHECTGTWPADRNLVADLERELAGEHPGDLVALMVKMIEACGAGRQGFLEHQDALAGLMPEKFQGEIAASCRAVELLSAARGYDKAFHCGHAGLRLSGAVRINLGEEAGNAPSGPLPLPAQRCRPWAPAGTS